MQLPPLNALRAFEATARLMSLSKAGDELHVTHAAISHQIKHLETWLGRKLLQKAGRGITLSAAGGEYYRAVSGSLAAIAHAGVQLVVGLPADDKRIVAIVLGHRFGDTPAVLAKDRACRVAMLARAMDHRG